MTVSGANGFVFFVNKCSPSVNGRKLLALGNPAMDEIFHLERIRGELDGPCGYALRVRYLNIPISPGEQVS